MIRFRGEMEISPVRRMKTELLFALTALAFIQLAFFNSTNTGITGAIASRESWSGATAPAPQAGTYARSLFVRGPVSVLVILPDGRTIGETPEGESINHLAGEGEIYKQAGAAGSYDWWIFLPETGYRVEIHAHDAGVLQVDVGGAGFDIADLRPGELLTFTVAPDGTPGPVTRSGGTYPLLGMDRRTWLIAGFGCMLVLGFVLIVVSGVGLARRGGAG